MSRHYNKSASRHAGRVDMTLCGGPIDGKFMLETYTEFAKRRKRLGEEEFARRGALASSKGALGTRLKRMKITLPTKA